MVATMKILNCILTNTDIEYPEVGTKYGFGKTADDVHTGVNIKCKNVYSICDGVVIDSAKYINGNMVLIQYDKTICFLYSMIRESFVVPGQLVRKSTILGTTDDFLHFEYLRTDNNPLSVTFIYKSVALHPNDPIQVLDGSYNFYSSTESKYSNYALEGDYSTEIITDFSKLPPSFLAETASMGEGE
jgi:murein DD-endopeptidase MepM/ murein hydrolase activator NlpD